MMETLPRLKVQGQELDLDDSKFGWLTDSASISDNFLALRERMERDGYLYLRDYLDRDQVQAARNRLLEALVAEGALDERYEIDAGVVRDGANLSFRPDLAQRNETLHRVLYHGAMMQFWRGFFGEEVRHFDFTWLRAIGPGSGTPPHCDIVYMGRGTRELFTAWTPLGDVPLETGGLLLLEGSHRHERLNENYGRKDVDAFCQNKVGANWTQMGGGGNIRDGGFLSRDAPKLQRALGGRWLTSPEFHMGDLLIFSVFTVHGSLDNQTNRVRLSSDSRYQRASHQADERWIGENPIGHGPEGKRGLIC